MWYSGDTEPWIMAYDHQKLDDRWVRTGQNLWPDRRIEPLLVFKLITFLWDHEEKIVAQSYHCVWLGYNNCHKLVTPKSGYEYIIHKSISSNGQFTIWLQGRFNLKKIEF